MAKKDKNEVPNPNAVPNRDILHRLNFLYQASVYLHSVDSSCSSSQPQTSVNDAGDQPKGKNRKTRRVRTGDLAKVYIDTMKVVSTKTTVRMDPSIKRTLCQGCNTVLVAGSTVSVRVRGSPSHGNSMTYTCLQCEHSRRISAPPTADQVDIDTTASTAAQSRRGLRKPTVPRIPPLFARDVGHVVFAGATDISAGNQVLGNGSFIS